MLSDVLHHLIDTNQTKASQLGRVAGVSSVTTIYNWLDNKGNPTEVAIRRWITLHPSVAVRTAILREITDNQASFPQPASEDEVNLDFNGDGQVDLGDAMHATIGYEGIAHETLKTIHAAYLRDPESISTHDYEAMIKFNETAISYMKAIDRICSEKVARRRQAKEVCCGIH